MGDGLFFYTSRGLHYVSPPPAPAAPAARISSTPTEHVLEQLPCGTMVMVSRGMADPTDLRDDGELVWCAAQIRRSGRAVRARSPDPHNTHRAIHPSQISLLCGARLAKRMIVCAVCSGDAWSVARDGFSPDMTCHLGITDSTRHVSRMREDRGLHQGVEREREGDGDDAERRKRAHPSARAELAHHRLTAGDEEEGAGEERQEQRVRHLGEQDDRERVERGERRGERAAAGDERPRARGGPRVGLPSEEAAQRVPRREGRGEGRRRRPPARRPAEKHPLATGPKLAATPAARAATLSAVHAWPAMRRRRRRRARQRGGGDEDRHRDHPAHHRRRRRVGATTAGAPRAPGRAGRGGGRRARRFGRRRSATTHGRGRLHTAQVGGLDVGRRRRAPTA